MLQLHKLTELVKETMQKQLSQLFFRIDVLNNSEIFFLSDFSLTTIDESQDCRGR